MDVSIKPLIDSATGAQWIRNCVGCHFSALGSEVSDSDIRSFAHGVLTLADTMVCESCGALPTRRPSGSYWQCTCGELELYPLVYPGADPRTIADEI
jgi:ribosomal protein L37AE/L43A